MAKTAFYTVRQPGLSRLSLQEGSNWTGVCYHDIRALTLSSDLLVLHHNQFLITLRGTNLRQLYLSLLVEEVYENPCSHRLRPARRVRSGSHYLSATPSR
jgi:hypothetical protein